MEKVLIIAYFYPPCNLTASARPAAWTEYLHRFGYYPIVITRNWDLPINTPSDISKQTGTDEKSQVSETATVYYLPYKPSLKDRVYARYRDDKLRMLRKALSFAELILQNFFLSAVPFHNFYEKAVALIESDNTIRKIVITANPFVSFFIGYRLKKRFPQIEWIADYRDDWNTTELIKHRNPLERIIFRLESASEKKWVATASYITSISNYYAGKISAFTGVKGRVLLNGFSDGDMRKVRANEPKDEFIITYNGTLYSSQPIEIFLGGYKKTVDKYSTQLKFKLCFPGLGFTPSSEQRVREIMKGYEQCLYITRRIPRQEVLEIQSRSHALLMIAHGGIKGVSSSKLYEYLCFRKPIILCPDDGDIIRETLNDTGLGVICNTAAEVMEKLSGMIEELLRTGKLSVPVNENRLMKYTRSAQVAELAEILNSLQT